MTYLYLIRHARSTWNAEGRMQGQADPPLDDLGQQQAQALGQRLKRETFSAIYSSPLQRARATAEAIAQPHHLSVQCDDRLMERHLGQWSGLTGDEANEQFPEIWAKSNWRLSAPPGGEDYARLIERVATVFDSILAAHPDHTSRVAVVSHGGTLSAYWLHLLGLTAASPIHFHAGNTAIARVRIEQGHVHILGLGDDRHLEASRLQRIPSTDAPKGPNG
jgi:broad specificity phosphatase PhoE